ncbi:MAG TPA: SIMPL domain-containing protein [Acidobacteriota bacterium]|nr:SIMPL domain-containing protein [Acidobacteriota bacterium]
MRPTRVFFALSLAVAFNPLFAQNPTQSSGKARFEGDPSQTIRIRQEGTVEVPPDTVYLLMKLETEAPLLGRAIEQNKKAAEEFVEALCRSGIDRASIRETNFVVSGSSVGNGTSFARNVVITVSSISRMAQGELNKLVARVQDLGARFGSSCITCIGSG